MDFMVKQEKITPEEHHFQSHLPFEKSAKQVPAGINLDGNNLNNYHSDDGSLDSMSSLSEDDDSVSKDRSICRKRKLGGSGIVLPLGFLDPLPPSPTVTPSQSSSSLVVKSCKQFWKAGDYEVPCSSSLSSGGLDHARVHPRFLHSNATSHKWALGAFAELLDNSVDEICHGATFVNVDALENQKDGSKMLLVEDDGGGMNVDVMRRCVSLGYSAKSKAGNTIGQYGNGFKTSTMRLGADVIVFSRCLGKDGKQPTQSIGMLSYTFLRSTGKDDIVVPILDFEKSGQNWNKIIRASVSDWDRNLETIVQWSPYSSQEDLLEQFNLMKDQGTRVIIYNLWEDDQRELELDFDTDSHDIQIRGVNRDETKIEMANNFLNSRHFLTYRHSLRSYTSILYLRLPPEFRIILRGKYVEHHNIVNDMMLVKHITYRPAVAIGVPRDSNLSADVTIGFVKDAGSHIDVQGFNVYHKNRLIKPFWRVWNAAGSDGRGVIGVLEANFVQPAHDKQGFENTGVLQKLKQRLLYMQKEYWRGKCHEVGYAPRMKKSRVEYEDKGKFLASNGKKSVSMSKDKKHEDNYVNEGQAGHALHENFDPCVVNTQTEETRSDPDLDARLKSENQQLKDRLKRMEVDYSQKLQVEREKFKRTQNLSNSHISESDATIFIENNRLKGELKTTEERFSLDLQSHRERAIALETKLKENNHKIEVLDKETERFIEMLSEERNRRDDEVTNLRNKLEEASNLIGELQMKVTALEDTDLPFCKQEPL